LAALSSADSSAQRDRPLDLVWRNVITRYLGIGVDGVIGLLLMPFTVAHLGASEYGVWALATS